MRADNRVAAGLTLPSADIYLSAHGMMENFGGGAESESRRRAARYGDRGDSEGSAIWLAIATAIDALRHNAGAAAERNTGT
ncbi:MAG: hypothetical protein H7X89_03895 [Rhizobiales bacterium]|nr:hypothetical protein [Hyphomicrobiales bacterium]